MWYWMLPSAGITAACITIPFYLFGGMNYLSNNGHYYKRNYAIDSRDHWLFIRDRRITGSEYKPIGLEGLGKPIDTKPMERERIEVPFKA